MTATQNGAYVKCGTGRKEAVRNTLTGPLAESKFLSLLQFCLIICVSNGTSASGDATHQQLFSETATLELTLEGPFRTLISERRDEPEMPALLRLTEPDGREIELIIQIKPRGNSRLRNCRFPPLRLNFKGDAAAGTVFEGQDKLKLVTHCKQTMRNRDYIAREYQIYRAYNLVTDRSFRVRWVLIEYVDIESRRKSFTEPGFLIEEDRAAAARLGVEVLETESLEIAELDRTETTLMALFQFMIGNLDWSALKGPPGEPCCHNFKVLADAGQTAGRIILPYDFDQSGFVDADYAVHNESLGVRSRDRGFKGYCMMNDEVDAAIDRMARIKQEWLAIIDAEPVSRYSRGHGIRYIERSYGFIEDPDRIERHIISKCRE